MTSRIQTLARRTAVSGAVVAALAGSLGVASSAAKSSSPVYRGASRALQGAAGRDSLSTAAASAWDQYRNLGSELCMTSGGNRVNGARVFQYPCNTSANQRWRLVPTFGGDLLQNEGTGTCAIEGPVAGSGNSLTNNAPIQLFTCEDSFGEPVIPTQIGAGRHLRLNNVQFKPSSFCYTSRGFGVNSGIEQWLCNNSVNQGFQVGIF